MEQFKQSYDEIMMKFVMLGRKIQQEHKYLGKYVACHGHIVRATFEMDPGQLAYVIELRTTPQGHQSYRRLFQEVYRQVEQYAPIFCKYIRVGKNAVSSRKAQEEKAEKRRM